MNVDKCEGRERTYRSFQLQIAPGAYGGFVLLGAFAFFLSNSWIVTVISWVWVGVMCCLDKPFFSLLLERAGRGVGFILLVACSLVLPVLIHHAASSALAEFIALLIVPVGGIAVAVFVYLVYTPENLERAGWLNKGGKSQ